MSGRGSVHAELHGTVPEGKRALCESTAEAERAREKLSALTVGEIHLHLTPWGAGRQPGSQTWGGRGAAPCVFSCPNPI